MEGFMIMFIGQQFYNMDIFCIFPFGMVAVCPPTRINTDEEEEFKVSRSLCFQNPLIWG